MEELVKDLFHQKKVAIVGPAKYMEKIKAGQEIDKCDTVVRINRSWESVEKYSENIGSRTDVLYSCLIEAAANAGVIDIEKYCELGIKMVVAPPQSNLAGRSYQTVFHSLVDTEKVKKLNKKIPVRLISHVFHTELAEKVECRPNTGFLAIYDILRYQPSALSIYGFSFYLDGFVTGVKEGIQQEQKKSEEEFATQCFNSRRHIQKNMWTHAKNTLLENPLVNLDRVLWDILNLEDLDKSLFEATQ